MRGWTEVILPRHFSLGAIINAPHVARMLQLWPGHIPLADHFNTYNMTMTATKITNPMIPVT